VTKVGLDENVKMTNVSSRMKMKMKIPFISFTTSGVKKNEKLIIFKTHGNVVHMCLNNM
jgi:hypothetical protein